MWIVVGHKSQLTWVPNGRKVVHHCTMCHQDATFYEKQATKTFRLYFLDVFDYERHRVMACGCCGAYYATDELGPPTSGIGEDLSDAASKAAEYASRAASATGGYLQRANNALSDGISSLRGRTPSHGSRPLSDGPAPARREQEEEGEIDIGPDYQGPARSRTAEVRKSSSGGVDDDMEARFRELEEKAAKGE